MTTMENPGFTITDGFSFLAPFHDRAPDSAMKALVATLGIEASNAARALARDLDRVAGNMAVVAAKVRAGESIDISNVTPADFARLMTEMVAYSAAIRTWDAVVETLPPKH